MPSPAARNPFRPSFGVSPAVLAGRDGLIEQFTLALLEGPGSPLRATLISGPRGSGKTVLLNELEEAARTQGWIVVRAYPGRGMLEELTGTSLPQALEELSGPAARRRIKSVSVTGIGSVSTEAVEPRRRPAATLISALRELAGQLRPHGTGVLLSVDEVQSAELEDLRAIATAFQDLVRDDLDIAFVAAGLPSGVHELLQHPGTTFLRRAEHVVLGPVSTAEAASAFARTVETGGRTVAAGAADAAAEAARGYPYLLQVLGSLSWARASLARREVIDRQTVAAAVPDAVARLGRQVHDPSLHRLPDGQLDFLVAMAQVADPVGRAGTGAIAKHLGLAPNGISERRKALIEADLITPDGYGFVAFTLPYLREHLLAIASDSGNGRDGRSGPRPESLPRR